LESFLILNNYQITYRLSLKSTTNYLRNFIETAKIIKIFHLELYQFLALISFAFLNFKRNEQKTSNWKHQIWNLNLNKYYQNRLLRADIWRICIETLERTRNFWNIPRSQRTNVVTKRRRKYLKGMKYDSTSNSVKT
jgi:hypothetical protein